MKYFHMKETLLQQSLQLIGTRKEKKKEKKKKKEIR